MADEYPEVVSTDRANVCAVISEMLDEPDENGIYRTTRAYNKLEDLLRAARLEAVGWAWTEACLQLDAGKDPREHETPELIERVERDLNPPAP